MKAPKVDHFNKKNIDYVNVFTYTPFIACAWSVSLTLVITSFTNIPLVVAEIIISNVLLMLAIYSLHRIWEYINKIVDIYPGMICWLAWLTYGMVTTDIKINIPEEYGIISGVFVLIMVASLYKPGLYDERTRRVLLVMGYSMLLLYFPCEDNIVMKMGNFMGLLRVILFYILFIVSSLERRVMANAWIQGRRAANKEITRESIQPFGGETFFYNSTERTILQSVWVLFIKSYFLIFGVAAIAATIFWLKRHIDTYDKRKRDDSFVEDIDIAREEIDEPDGTDIENTAVIIEVCTDEEGDQLIIEDVSEYNSDDQDIGKNL